MQDYEELLTELEELVSGGKKSLFGNMVSVNPDAIYAIVDRLRENMPSMLREASFIKNDMERRRQEDLHRAQEIIETAKNRAEKMLDEHSVIKEAERRANTIVQEALEYKERMVNGTNENLLGLLSETRNALTQSMQIIDMDISEIRNRQYSDEFNGK